MHIPVLIYSIALVSMTAISASISKRMALGGFLFMISDILIGIEIAGFEFSYRIEIYVLRM